jgi:hypothetical protein
MAGKNIMKTSKSRWHLLTSEVIATSEFSDARLLARPLE